VRLAADTVAAVDATERAVAAATAPDVADVARFATDDPDPTVRAFALATLVGRDPTAALPIWRRAADDGSPRVRRRAAEVAPRLGRRADAATLRRLLADPEPWVAEAAAFAAGEHPRPAAGLVAAVAGVVTDHPDPVVREAAVAALGSIGDPTTLPAVLGACADRPAVRRRAVLALAAFDGPEVEARLAAALDDRDWQVRQAAEDLLRAGSPDP